MIRAGHGRTIRGRFVDSPCNVTGNANLLFANCTLEEDSVDSGVNHAKNVTCVACLFMRTKDEKE